MTRRGQRAWQPPTFQIPRHNGRAPPDPTLVPGHPMCVDSPQTRCPTLDGSKPTEPGCSHTPSRFPVSCRRVDPAAHSDSWLCSPSYMQARAGCSGGKQKAAPRSPWGRRDDRGLPCEIGRLPTAQGCLPLEANPAALTEMHRAWPLAGPRPPFC